MNEIDFTLVTSTEFIMGVLCGINIGIYIGGAIVRYINQLKQ